MGKTRRLAVDLAVDKFYDQVVNGDRVPPVDQWRGDLRLTFLLP